MTIKTLSGGQAAQAANPRGRKARKTKSLLPEGFSPRYAAFVDNYMVHFNGARAAREAGYSPRSARVTASDLISNPIIRAEIDRRREALAENLHDVSEDRIKLELARCGLANMGDYLVPGEDGAPLLNFAHLTRDQTAALGEVTVEEFRDGRSDRRQVRRTKFKLVDKKGSLELLAKIKGMIVEKGDVKHQHQGLIVHAMLQEIDAAQRGKPIVEAVAVSTGQDAMSTGQVEQRPAAAPAQPKGASPWRS